MKKYIIISILAMFTMVGFSQNWQYNGRVYMANIHGTDTVMYGEKIDRATGQNFSITFDVTKVTGTDCSFGFGGGPTDSIYRMAVNDSLPKLVKNVLADSLSHNKKVADWTAMYWPYKYPAVYVHKGTCTGYIDFWMYYVK